MINKNYGADVPRDGLTEAEVVIMREMAHEKKLPPSHEEEANKVIIEELATEFNCSPAIVDKVLEGEILQYAGGPLRPLPLQGCNPRFLEATRNRQRFVRGIVQRAFEILDQADFEIFVNAHGMTLKEAKFYLRNLGAANDRLTHQRYRAVLRGHAAGQGIEQAISTFNKRSRSKSD